MTTIATVDLKNIHEIYKQIKVDYPEYSERFVYFLAACLYLDPEINLEIVLKLRPYGGLIGIDNSSLDTYLKSYKFLRLHAILHDASGLIAEQSERPWIFIRFTLSNHKRLHWSHDWINVLPLRENF